MNKDKLLILSLVVLVVCFLYAKRDRQMSAVLGLHYVGPEQTSYSEAISQNGVISPSELSQEPQGVLAKSWSQFKVAIGLKPQQDIVFVTGANSHRNQNEKKSDSQNRVETSYSTTGDAPTAGDNPAGGPGAQAGGSPNGGAQGSGGGGGGTASAGGGKGSGGSGGAGSGGSGLGADKNSNSAGKASGTSAAAVGFDPTNDPVKNASVATQNTFKDQTHLNMNLPQELNYHALDLDDGIAAINGSNPSLGVNLSLMAKEGTYTTKDAVSFLKEYGSAIPGYNTSLNDVIAKQDPQQVPTQSTSGLAGAYMWTVSSGSNATVVILTQRKDGKGTYLAVMNAPVKYFDNNEDRYDSIVNQISAK